MAGLATLGAIALAVAAPGRSSIVLHWYAVVLAGSGAWFLLRLLAVALPGHHPSVFEAIKEPRQTPADPLPELEHEERTVSFSSWLASDFHFRLRPLLREIAGDRLAVRRAVDLAREPEAARRLLGQPAWAAVQQVPEPRDRYAKGPSLAEIGEILSALEAL
ncbi:MAG: hypothetical protein J2P45_31890 [Candidatus Dormibacteraeota bacterium]|nr:hypothetical protein [Candidatus Dormibacteraeota bacterium]